MRLIASNYTKVNEQLGLSFSGNYHHNDGFFTNLHTHKKADKLDNGAGRIGLTWKPAAHWTTRFITSYEYSNQGGYPYGLYNADKGTTEAVNYNNEGLYRRNPINIYRTRWESIKISRLAIYSMVKIRYGNICIARNLRLNQSIRAAIIG